MAEFNGFPLVRANSKRAWELLRQRRSFYLRGKDHQRYYVNRGAFATPVAADGRTPTGAPFPAKNLLDPAKGPGPPASGQNAPTRKLPQPARQRKNPSPGRRHRIKETNL